MFAGSFITVLWLDGWHRTPSPKVTAPSSTSRPDIQRDPLGFTHNEARQWLNEQSVPNATTPFLQRMRDNGYALDNHTHQWYNAELSQSQYHCTWLPDYGHDGVYLSCPGQRPPGIPDQSGN
jgi:hypothetical protein